MGSIKMGQELRKSKTNIKLQSSTEYLITKMKKVRKFTQNKMDGSKKPSADYKEKTSLFMTSEMCHSAPSQYI